MRLSELYASTQGEGPNVGETTVFVRFGGCNLRCPGWPCDTAHAVDPVYRKEWSRPGVSDLAEQTASVAMRAGASLITLTGGEPFLQPSAELAEYTETLVTDHGYRFEAFTNGTIQYPDWALDRVAMIMDWKLPGSGEDPSNPARILNVERLANANIRHAVKFVCKDEQDFHVAAVLYNNYLRHYKGNFDVYYGRVWDGEITNARLVELVMTYQLPWKLNVQMHNYIWPANERGR